MVLLRFLLLRVFHSFNVLLKWGRDISDSKQFENDSAPRENTLKSLFIYFFIGEAKISLLFR